MFLPSLILWLSTPRPPTHPCISHLITSYSLQILFPDLAWNSLGWKTDTYRLPVCVGRWQPLFLQYCLSGRRISSSHKAGALLVLIFQWLPPSPAGCSTQSNLWQCLDHVLANYGALSLETLGGHSLLSVLQTKTILRHSRRKYSTGDLSIQQGKVYQYPVNSQGPRMVEWISISQKRNGRLNCWEIISKSRNISLDSRRVENTIPGWRRKWSRIGS